MRTLALFAVLGLAGCGGLFGVGDAPDSTPLGQCQRRALDDPDVQAAIQNSNSPLQEVRVPGVRAEAIVKQRAVQRCLAGRGLAPAGGVEPVQGD